MGEWLMMHMMMGAMGLKARNSRSRDWIVMSDCWIGRSWRVFRHGIDRRVHVLWDSSLMLDASSHIYIYNVWKLGGRFQRVKGFNFKWLIQIMLQGPQVNRWRFLVKFCYQSFILCLCCEFSSYTFNLVNLRLYTFLVLKYESWVVKSVRLRVC